MKPKCLSLLLLFLLLFSVNVAASATELNLHISNASLTLPNFLHPFIDLTGSIKLVGDLFSTDDLRFRVLNSTFRLEGSAARAGRRHDLRLQAIEIPPGDLVLLLPASEGFVPLTPPQIHVRFQRQGPEETRSFAIRVDRFRFSQPKLGPSMQDLPGSNLIIRAEDSRTKLSIPDFRFQLFGGELKYSQTLDKQQGLEKFRARLDKLRLDQLAERLPRWKGRLGGRLTVSARKDNQVISGSFRLDNGWLRDLKALQRLADNLGVDGLERINFARLSAGFKKQGPVLTLTDIEFSSDLLDASFSLKVTDDTEQLEGRGWVRIHLKALSGSKKLKNLGILRGIFRKNTLRMKLSVSGTLDDPDIRIRL